MDNIFNFNVKDIDNNEISLSKYNSKTLLIVNVASYCGLTYQYKGLQQLYEKLKDKNFEVLAFPCNQFAKQEPGNNYDIKNFCETSFKVTFEVFGKIDVNGKNADPLFSYLKSKKPGAFGTQSIKWNFSKFLVNKNGEVIKRFSPRIEPKEIQKDILAIL